MSEGQTAPSSAGGATIHGDVDEGYGPVADAFRANFETRGEIGAACAVYRGARKVVDLWGGQRDADTRQPWLEDTLVTVFSTTKGVAALLVARALAAGRLSLDVPVAEFWPEFAAHGKDQITVRQLLAHQAGLPALDRRIGLAEINEPAVLAEALAGQRPLWAPGSRHGYGPNTLGWYEAELLRRTDDSQRSIGTILREDVSPALGVEFYIGVPEDVDPERIATIRGFAPWRMMLHLNQMPPRFVLGFLRPGSLTQRAFATGQVGDRTDAWNRPEVRAAELPASNGTGQVRALARLYADAATGGTSLGLDPAVHEALVAPANPPSGGRRDLVLTVETTYALGFWKPFETFVFGSDEAAFGAPGAGGSFACADPTTGVGFAYAPNRSGFCLWDDPREVALREALFSAVLGMRSQHAGR